jgi:hypothetical protein
MFCTKAGAFVLEVINIVRRAFHGVGNPPKLEKISVLNPKKHLLALFWLQNGRKLKMNPSVLFCVYISNNALPMAMHGISAKMDTQKDCVNIVLDASGCLMVKILSVHGRFVKTIKQPLHLNSGNLAVKLDDLSSGTYVLNVFKDNSFIKSFHYNKN